MAASPTRDLLLEIGTEDLPARFGLTLSEALARSVVTGLKQRGVSMGASSAFATPRRIAVWVRDVAVQQPEQRIERLGPALGAAIKDGKPTPAGAGFARSCGVEFSELGEKDGKLQFARVVPGRPTPDLLPELFEDTLKQMDELVPKRMRWGSGEETFVRPVEWLCCLFGDEVVPLHRFGLQAGRLTYGHRFHAPAAISLASPSSYAEALRGAKVMADFGERRAEIDRQIKAEAARLQGHARVTDDLLDEVTALVEWPVAITGQFEQRFQELPPEVIVATVETNQRYFTVFEDAAHTRMTAAFITVTNIVSRDVAQVIQGNERVVRPRLSDALFFWQQDLKQAFGAFGTALESTTYQRELGTVAAKEQRIATLARMLAVQLGEDAEGQATAARAATLCKHDLVSKVVYEFPELQGLMGGYYAEKSGESATVARAIREHYLPTQQGTPIPSTRWGQIVALADKLDTLAGIFAIGQKPSASKDPFALRRAALGVLRICIEGQLSLDLRALLRAALDAQPTGKRDVKTLSELVDFVMERLRALLVGQILEGREIATETFESVHALAGGSPLDLKRRVAAVHRFVSLPEAPNLAAAHKRARNLLKQAGPIDDALDVARFEHVCENALHESLQALARRNAATTDYTEKLVNLASLRAPVDAFFEAVMVNAEDPAVRSNRLLLLQELDRMCREVADLSCLPG